VPEEVEAALLRDRSVRDAAVLGVADNRLGEIPVALVESTSAPGTILERVADRLAPYKRPRRVFVGRKVARVPNGKVDRPAAGVTGPHAGGRHAFVRTDWDTPRPLPANVSARWGADGSWLETTVSDVIAVA